MDWAKLTFDWNQTRAFWATAETGSLSAAARVLSQTQPTLSRQVNALEKSLGVALFERIGRDLVLTPIGHELLDHSRKMGVAAEQMARAAADHSQELEGSIAITASEIYASQILPPIVAKLRHRHPGIEIKIIASNAPTDLLRREADIAIRNYTSSDNELIAIKIKDDTATLYATPDYLNKIGNPESLAQLGNADFVGFATTLLLSEGLKSLGIPVSSHNFKVVSDNMLVQWSLVKAGIGIGVVPHSLGDTEPLVKRVLANTPMLQFPMWLVTHRELHTNKRVRVVFDFLKDQLRATHKTETQPS